MVGQWTLDPLIGVRIPAPQPYYLFTKVGCLIL